MRVSARGAWLMVGQSPQRKRERRRRWMEEVVEQFDGSPESYERAIAVFHDELDEDRL
jgi:hypothetical protein